MILTLLLLVALGAPITASADSFSAGGATQVVYQANGKLDIVPIVAIQDTAKTTKKHVPQTGINISEDQSQALFFASSAVLLGLLVGYRRLKQQESQDDDVILH